MMLGLGDVPASSTLYIPFHTFNSSGASVTITGLAVGDILIYKNGSTTQRSSTSGFTLLDTDGIDFDSVTGVHGFSIDLSDNTDAGFYVAGSFYWVVISSITVNAQTVNFVAATFRIRAADNTAGYQVVDAAKWNNLATVALPLIPTVAGRTLDCSAGGEAGVDWANVGSPTTAVNLSGTTVNLTNTVTTYTGNTLQTADVATLITTVGAAGAGLTGVALSLAGRQAIATTALVESYAALHAAPTWAQAIFGIIGMLSEKAVAATTLTVNKIDGVTPAMTFTLNDATSPTAITRAS